MAETGPETTGAQAQGEAGPVHGPPANRPFADVERAREAGRRSHKAKVRKLHPDDVERELGALDTVADAARWLRLIGLWTVQGRLSASAGAVATKALDTWLRGWSAGSTDEILARTRQELAKVKRALRDAERRPSRVA